MSRPQETGVVLRKSININQPDLTTTTTIGETWVFVGMQNKGRAGVTTRDFLGADLRSHIRRLKHKGIGIRDEWETDAFSRHKRWWLKDGHTIELVPKKTKPAGKAAKRVSNPKKSNREIGDFSDV